MWSREVPKDGRHQTSYDIVSKHLCASFFTVKMAGQLFGRKLQDTSTAQRTSRALISSTGARM